MVSGWRVEVRGRDLRSVGPCDVWTSLKATIRHRRAGGWTLSMPARHPQAALFGQGAGILVWAPWSDTEPWFSGPALELSAVAPSATDSAVLTITGMDDTGQLADRLAMPAPASPMHDQSAAAYWQGSGPAEWVIRKVVDVNAGLSARPERRLCDADPTGKLPVPSACSGSHRDVHARFDTLLTLVDSVAAVDNLSVALVHDPASGVLRLLVAPTVDRSAAVRLSQPAGTITTGNISITAPRTTHVLVAGGGEETARVLALQGDDALAGTWRRIESLRDARDTTDPAILAQRGQEALAEGTATGGAQVQPMEMPGQRFGHDYNLGDLVGVDFSGVSWTEVVTAVTVDVSKDGTTVTPTLGDETAASTSSPAIYTRVRDLTRRLDQLERRR